MTEKRPPCDHRDRRYSWGRFVCRTCGDGLPIWTRNESKKRGRYRAGRTKS